MWRLFVCVSVALVGCSSAPKIKRVNPPPPGGMQLRAAAFVDANAIAVRIVEGAVRFQEWEVHGTNYLESGGPMGQAAVLTFPTDAGIIYRVEGKHINLNEPKGATDTGWKGCNWHVRSLPFTGTGDLMSVTQAVVETEFFRVRRLID